MTGYVRKDTTNNIADGNVINAADLDSEFDGVQDAFNASTGHKHDGTAGEGATINALGPTQDVTVSSTLLAPKTTNTVDIGSSALKFKDLFLAGNASVGGTLAVTGVATLGAGAILNTPASVTLTNATGLPIATGVSGLGTGIATFLATPSSANLIAAVTNETGTGSLVFATSPTLVTPILGTPTSATLTNATGLPLTTGVTGTLPTANGGTNLTSFTSGGVVYASSTSALATGSNLTYNGTALTTTTTSGIPLVVTGTGSVGARIIGGTGAGFGSYLSFQAQGANAAAIGTDSSIFGSGTSNNLVLYGYSTNSIIMAPSTAEVARFTSTGLGIGTSSPVSKLQSVDGDITVTTSASFVGFNSTRAGVPTANGQQLGRLNFNAYSTGTTYVTGASVQSYSNAAWSSISAPSYLSFQTTPSGSTSLVERLVIDSAGNLGLGVTPSAWGSGSKGFQVLKGGLWHDNSQYFSLVNNAYYDGTNWKYISVAAASQIAQVNGESRFYTSTSTPVIGNDPVFTQAVTIDASGGFLVGLTSNPNSYRAIIQGKNTTTSLGGEAVLNLFDGNANSEYSNLRFATSSDGPLAVIGAKAVTGGAYPSSVGQLEFAVQNGASTTTAMVIDSSANLLVGTTSTSTYTGNSLAYEPTGSYLVQNHASAKASGAAYTYFQHNGSEIGSVTQVDTTSIALNNVSRIKFPATQSASSDANTLDDYEEGTWEPTLNFNGGTTGITYDTIRVGRYTKIGRIVTVSFSIILTSKGSSTGNANISGLPFASFNNGGANPAYAGTVVGEGNMTLMPTGTYCMPWSDSSLYLRVNGAASFSPITNTNFTNTSAIYGSVTYEVT